MWQARYRQRFVFLEKYSKRSRGRERERKSGTETESERDKDRYSDSVSWSVNWVRRGMSP